MFKVSSDFNNQAPAMRVSPPLSKEREAELAAHLKMHSKKRKQKYSMGASFKKQVALWWRLRLVSASMRFNLDTYLLSVEAVNPFYDYVSGSLRATTWKARWYVLTHKAEI